VSVARSPTFIDITPSSQPRMTARRRNHKSWGWGIGDVEGQQQAGHMEAQQPPRPLSPCPMPMEKTKGWPRSREESNLRPSGKVPAQAGQCLMSRGRADTWQQQLEGCQTQARAQLGLITHLCSAR
jgi:hypothetical protein